MILDCTDTHFQLSLPYSSKDLAKQIPGRRWDPDAKVWAWPKTLVNFLVIRDRLPNLLLSRDCSRWLRQRTTIPNLPVNGSLDDRLWPFQEYGVSFLKHVGRVLLADEMGLGKTVQALVAAQSLGCRRVLVLCPKSLMWNWEAETVRWTVRHQPVVITGSTPDKRESLDTLPKSDGPYIAITNWETARSIELNVYPWDLIVGDEAHRIRNRKTQLAEAVTSLKAPRLWLLSGTPIQNTPEDLWTLLNWLYPKEFGSFWQFFEAFVDYRDGLWGRDVLGSKNLDALYKIIAPFTLRRSKAEVLPDLPEKLQITMPVKLGNRQTELYRDIERQVLIELSEDEQLFIPCALARLTRLKQAALCPAVLGDDLAIGDAKLSAAADLILDNPSEQFVVYSQYAEVIKIFQAGLAISDAPSEVLVGEMDSAGRQRVVTDFVQGRLRVLCATLGTGGVGLNFTPCSNAIFLDHPWNPAVVQQAEDRIHRIGQQDTCRIYHFIARNTIDETIQHILRAKSEVAGRVLTPLEVLKRHYGA